MSMRCVLKNLFEKLLAIVAILKLLNLVLPVEFSNNNFRESVTFYHNTILITFLFIYLLIKVLSDKSGLEVWARVLLLIPLITVFLLTISMVLFMGVCKYEEVEILYVEKHGNAMISRRRTNCGATTDYSYATYYIKPLTSYLNFR